MKKTSWLFPLALLLGVMLYLQWRQTALPQGGISTLGADTAQAEVIQILEEGEGQRH